MFNRNRGKRAYKERNNLKNEKEENQAYLQSFKVRKINLMILNIYLNNYCNISE